MMAASGCVCVLLVQTLVAGSLEKKYRHHCKADCSTGSVIITITSSSWHDLSKSQAGRVAIFFPA